MLQTACDVSTIAEIEREHALLWDRLARFYELLPCLPGEEQCDSCTTHKLQACQQILDDYLVDLLASLEEHFAREDAAMRSFGPNQGFAAHLEDHADIIERFGNAISTAPIPAERLEIKKMIGKLLKEHFAIHDAPMIARLRGYSPAEVC